MNTVGSDLKKKKVFNGLPERDPKKCSFYLDQFGCEHH